MGKPRLWLPLSPLISKINLYDMFCQREYFISKNDYGPSLMSG